MRWFRKPAAPAQESNSDYDRYAGKPLLALLESYVLECIGQLPSEKETALIQIVQRVYGGGSDWKATLRSVLHLDDSLDESLRQMWTKNQDIAHQAGVRLSPEEYARMVVDQNFAQLIDQRT